MRDGYVVPKFPKRVEIELSSSCNLRCVYCPRQYLDINGFMDFEVFKKIIGELEKHPETMLVLHRRGESLLHPRIKDMLSLVAGKFREVQMATNGTLLTNDKYGAITRGLTFISFSIDIPKNFDKTRIPAKYADVEKKILDFLKYNKGKIKTQVSMVKTEKTSKEAPEEFKKIWKGKVDRVRVYEEHSVDGVFGKMKNPRKERKPCVMPIYELLIYSDGTVGRCNHDWKGSSLGDIKKQTIAEVWRSSKYNDLRRQHKALKIVDDVCKGCDAWYPELGNQGTGDVFTNEG